jgi:AI-2 transport protein TqsA
MTSAITPARQPPSFGRVLLVLAATVVMAAGMRVGAPILNTILFAVVLSLIFNPVYSWLKRRGLPALLIMLVGLSILFGVLFTFLSVSIGKFTGRLAYYTTQLEIRTDEFQTLLEGLGVPNIDLWPWPSSAWARRPWSS